MAAPVLAYNGYDCATGQPWAYQKIPGWGIAFLVLDLVSIPFAGWLWAFIALLVTAVVIRSKLNVAVKIILCILLLAAAVLTGQVFTAFLTSL